jgi:hypothetical protein
MRWPSKFSGAGSDFFGCHFVFQNQQLGSRTQHMGGGACAPLPSLRRVLFFGDNSPANETL